MQPEQLNANRVYFTEFDRATYSQVAWAEEDVKEIVCFLERKIKLLALTMLRFVDELKKRYVGKMEGEL